MKKTIIILIALCLVQAKVENIKNRTSIFTDYRDVYVGSYFCHSITGRMFIDNAPGITRDTVTIYVSKDSQDSVLQITVSSSVQKFKLKSSILYGYPEGSYRGGKFFSSDSISLNIALNKTTSGSYFGKKN